MTSAISVKDRLKKQAMQDGKTMHDKLVTYGLERTIYRISVSEYREKFTLKGGIFLYALFDGEFARATMDMDAPKVYAYSLYSAIAEKFEAIVSLGLANSRYKDFYDIYVLAAKYDLDGTELQNAVMETFRHRETDFEDIAAFEEGFTEDRIRESRWNAFIKKKKAMVAVSFPDAVREIKNLLVPIVNSIQKNETFASVWDADRQLWK